MGKAELLAFDGTAVAAAFAGAFAGAFALGAAGTAVGEVELLLAAGTDVADDPQANSRATNNRTIAFGKFRITRSLRTECSTCLPLLILTTFCG